MRAVIFSIEQYELNLEGPRTWAEIIFYSSVQKTLSARAADQPTRTFEAFAHQAILQPDRLPDVTARFLVSLKKLVTRSGALEQPDLSCYFLGNNSSKWNVVVRVFRSTQILAYIAATHFGGRSSGAVQPARYRTKVAGEQKKR